MLKEKSSFSNVMKQIKRKKVVYAMMIPGLVWAILFCYIPMYGIIIAFQDYTPQAGYFGSPWVGLKNFKEMFNGDFGGLCAIPC